METKEATNSFVPLYDKKDIPRYQDLDYTTVTKSDDFNYIYRPGNDTIHLLDTLRLDLDVILEAKPLFCMEIGSGSGFIINSFAKWLKDEKNTDTYMIATDINYDANETTKKLAEYYKTGVEAIRANIAAGLNNRLEGKVDVIICNPPYVPTPEDEFQDAIDNFKLQNLCFEKNEVEGRRRKANMIGFSYAGGEKGTEIIHKMLMETKRLLSVGGLFYLLLIEENEPQKLIETYFSKGYSSQLILKETYKNEVIYTFRIKKEAPETL